VIWGWVEWEWVDRVERVEPEGEQEWAGWEEWVVWEGWGEEEWEGLDEG
jgi:hypothetical protein